MSTRMLYGNYEFSPVPVFSWSTETISDPKLEELSLRHTLAFTGTLLGSPAESGTFVELWNKRDALHDALASGTQHFQIIHDGQVLLSGVYPKVLSFEFAEGTWADRINYSFTLQYDEDFYIKGIQSYNESWAFEEQEDRTTALVSHDLSAVGINTAASGNNSLLNARTYVLSKSGYSNIVAGLPAFVQVSGSYSAYEELRSEQADVAQGSYSISERFILSSGTYIHTRTATFDIDNDGVGTVSIAGNVKGLGRSTNAYTRAIAGWNTDVKPYLPANASGIYTELGGEGTIYTSTYQSFSVTKNSFAGTIDYSVSYSDSPLDNLPSGIQDFTISVSDQKPIRLYASFPIMERSLGNVVQDIATSTEGQFSINGSCVGKTNYPFVNVLSYVEDQVNLRRPLPANYVTLRLSSQNITKEEEKNSINFGFTWTYTKELSSVVSQGPIIIS